MSKLNSNDAEMLLRVMAIYLSEPMKKSRRFWRTIPDGLGLEELTKKYPRGSEGYENIGNMMIFWETVGSLLKRNLLNQDLAFDTFLDAPPWPKVERFFKEIRKKENNLLEGENVEIAFKLSEKWKKARSRKQD